ncbi:MAG: GTPase HflX [Thermodesulfobacteriota bacterium]
MESLGHKGAWLPGRPKEGGAISRLAGNYEDLKTSQRRRLERLARGRVPRELIVGPEMARSLSELSFEIGRQLGLLIDRSGAVESLVVGDSHGLVIPRLGAARAGAGRLCGLRLVHTHLGGEDLSQDDLMDLVFLRLDLLAMVQVGRDGLPERLYAAHLLPRPQDGQSWAFLPPVVPSQQPGTCLALIEALEEELTRLQPGREVEAAQDRAILVSVTTGSRHAAEESMDELRELTRSDGVQVLDTVIQRRDRINPKWIMGRGKLAEIMLLALQRNANLLVFDQELNPSQIRSITDHTELRVIDRTQLILDIFARRARSREGKLQIEMAQLKYLLPRLVTRDDALSRLSGGIGGRGPGETRLEVDRRRVRDRLRVLSDKLAAVGRERSGRRSRRRKREVPVISLVGYTNAGKSTLLNTLTDSRILAEDRLFATLDPTSRRLRFPEDLEVIVTDTVGFIRDLPADLLKAFKSTLEELAEADLLVQVIDLANPRFEEQMQVVAGILEELDLTGIPILPVFNKIDLVPPELVEIQCRRHGGVGISALDPATLRPFLLRAQGMITKALGLTAKDEPQNVQQGMSKVEGTGG